MGENPKYRRRLEMLKGMLSSWLAEVEGELAEASSILEGTDGSNRWWAEKIRSRLKENARPEVAIAGEDQASTLLEIAFWSGWLRGELDTLQRCSITVHTLALHDSRQSTLPLSRSPALEGEAVNPARAREAVMNVVRRIDERGTLPGAELVSIHLSNFVDDGMPCDASCAVGECLASLDEFLSSPSQVSLVGLSFKAGMLAGYTACLVEGGRGRPGGGGGDR